MNCCITELTRKEVINIRTGNSLGSIGDVEVNVRTGQLVAIVLYPRRFGFGRGEEFRIAWNDIKIIGEDTVLVDINDDGFCFREDRRALMDSLFRH